jgi:interferon gamma-inducible protein 30
MLRGHSIIDQATAAVTVQTFTESLCIGCKEFLTKELIPTYKELGSEVIDFQLVPFGNAKIDETAQTVECQHGVAECDANTWEQCGVDNYDPSVYLDYVGCLEESLEMGYREDLFDVSIFQNCAHVAGMDFKKLQECHDNPMMAWQLQQKYAHLTPDHKYVPWVLIDGNFFDPEKEHFVEEVCKAYAAKGGTDSACTELLLEAADWN